MSFWDRLGKAADVIQQLVNPAAPVAGAFGAAWAAAHGSSTDQGATSLGHILGAAAQGAQQHSALTAVGEVPGMSALRKPYQYGVARPLSTFIQVGQDQGAGTKPFWDKIVSADDWRQAWNRSATVSPGQAFVTTAIGNIPGVNTPGPVQSDPFAPANRPAQQQYFHNTPAGRISSGTTDLALNWFADPLVLGGKAASASRLARTNIAPEDVTGALQFSTGEANKAQVGRSAAVAGAKLQRLYTDTDGMTFLQMLSLPQFAAAPDSTAVAYFFDQANKIADPAARYAAKRDAFGALLGDRASVARVQSYGDTAAEMRALMSQPEVTAGGAYFNVGDYGASEQAFFNSPDKIAELDALKTKVQNELDVSAGKAASLLEQAGSTSKIAPTLKDRFAQNLSGTKMHEAITYEGGFASRPIRIITGSTSSTAQGMVNTVDVREGLGNVEGILGSARWMAPDDKAYYLRQFATAPTREDRNVVVWKLENAMFTAAAAHYGYTPADARKLLDLASGVRRTWQVQLSNRLYSAADESHVSMIDPEGVATFYDKPFLQSQLENGVPLTDPKLLDSVLKMSKKNGWLESLREGNEVTVGLGPKALDFTDALGTTLLQGWKFAALLRPAYPMRIQVDTQMRMLSALGAMEYASNLMSGGRTLAMQVSDKLIKPWQLRNAPADVVAAESADRAEQIAGRKLLRQQETYKGVDITAARNADEQARAERLLGMHHTALDLLMSDETSKSLAVLRGSGDWGIVKGADRGWGRAWLRAVNQQIRNSPVASRVVAGMSDDEIVRAMQDHPELAKEWANFEDRFDNPQQWITVVRNHISHTIPSNDLQAIAAERNVSAADVQRYFANPKSRPTVHGESFTPYGTGGEVSKRYKQFRNWWFKFSSDVPESVMGRHPLYNAKFRQHMVEQVDRHQGDVVTGADADRFRRNADNLARRDVSNILFDVSKMSGHAHALRYLAPFFSAWEDTMVKWAGLLYDNPDQIIRLSQIWSAPNAAGIVVDSEGNRVLPTGETVDHHGNPIKDKTYPGNGEYVVLPKWLSPVPGGGQLRIRKDSFNIVFQGQPWWLPGFGPAVQVPANEIVRKAFPDQADDPVMKYVLPYGLSDDDLKGQAMPSWWRQVRSAFGGTKDYANTYTMLMAQELSLYQQGLRPKPTSGEIAQKTRNWFILRAALNSTAPVSIQPTPKLQFYVDQAHEYQRKYGLDWQTKFYQDFPQYFDMAVSLTRNDTGIVASDKAYRASKKYRSLIADNPEYGWMFVGPDNYIGPNSPFSQGVYTYQETSRVSPGSSQTFRSSRDPRESIAAINAERGWINYDQGRQLLDTQLEARGLHSVTQKGAEDLAAGWANFKKALATDNPDWFDAFTTRDEGKVQKMVSAAEEGMQRDKTLAKRPDMQALQTYLTGRAMMRTLLQSRPKTSLASNPDLQAQWDGFVAALQRDNIGFAQMFSRVLEADNLTGDIRGG